MYNKLLKVLKNLVFLVGIGFCTLVLGFEGIYGSLAILVFGIIYRFIEKQGVKHKHSLCSGGE